METQIDWSKVPKGTKVVCVNNDGNNTLRFMRVYEFVETDHTPTSKEISVKEHPGLSFYAYRFIPIL